MQTLTTLTSLHYTGKRSFPHRVEFGTTASMMAVMAASPATVNRQTNEMSLVNFILFYVCFEFEWFDIQDKINEIYHHRTNEIVCD